MRSCQETPQGVFVNRALGELAAHIAARMDRAVDSLASAGEKDPAGKMGGSASTASDMAFPLSKDRAAAGLRLSRFRLAGLLTWLHTGPRLPKPCGQWHLRPHPRYSVGHVVELHHIPDSPLLRGAPDRGRIAHGRSAGNGFAMA
jgi:hypothetical protein